MPITPEEAIKKQTSAIPPQVFEAFDELITENLQGRVSTVIQDDVVALIKSKLNRSDGGDFLYRWLKIEDAYEAAGWKVEYEKPGFNESYKIYFKFTAK